jgi:hypothetical protein
MVQGVGKTASKSKETAAKDLSDLALSLSFFFSSLAVSLFLWYSSNCLSSSLVVSPLCFFSCGMRQMEGEVQVTLVPVY